MELLELTMAWSTETSPGNRKTFARRPRVRQGDARHVTFERVRLSTARRLDAPGASQEPATLVTAAEVAEPVSAGLASAIPSAGSVDLAGLTDRESAQSGRRGLAARTASPRREPDIKDTDANGHGDGDLPLAKRLAYLLQPPVESFLREQSVIEWPHPFFDYQRDGIRALVARDVLLLADDMGLGKTIQTVAALRILFRLRRIESALLVVPASLVLQWRRAIREWAPDLRTSSIRGPAAERALQWQAPVHVYLTSYETVRSDFTENVNSPPRRRVWDVVLLDEAQRIKNRDSETSRVCKQLPRRRAWALTGTPLENDIDDLASIVKFLQPWTDGDDLRRYVSGPDLHEQHRAIQLRRRNGMSSHSSRRKRLLRSDSSSTTSSG